MSADAAPALRDAVVNHAPAAQILSTWRDAPAVFTRRPVPDDALMPLMIVNPPAAVTDEDALKSPRPVIVRDLMMYGRKAAPGDPADQTRAVDALGWIIRDLFHRQKFSVRIEGYSVTDIVVSGPMVAPVDDDQTVGRAVRLTVRLQRS